MQVNVQNDIVTDAHQKEVTVHVLHVGEHEHKSFKVLLSITLLALWDLSYKELGIPKKDRDVFQAPHKPNPVDLTPYLGLTLAEAQRKELCEDHFEIVAGTGGA
jgi:hypothetical protein